MNLASRFLAVAALAASSALAQPVISGVMNAASYALPGLPNANIARGSMFVIFGSNMGPATLQQAGGFPLPLALGGTGVRVNVGGTPVDAFLIYSSAGQIAAVLPSNTPEGNGTLAVTFNNQTSSTTSIRVVRSSFGAFSVNQAGSGPGIIQNFISQTDQPVNALNKPARPGQVMILWGTGLGPVAGDDRMGPAPGDLPFDVQVYVGGKRANVTYKGRSGCCAGIDQIVFTVPDGVEGCYVPVVVQTGDVVSNFTSLSVARTGEACSDANLRSDDLVNAQQSGSLRTGGVDLSRVSFKISSQGQTIESKTDSGSAYFMRYSLDNLLRSQGAGSVNAVSLGACTIYTFRGSSPAFVDPVKPTILNAGESITVVGPRGTKRLMRDAQSGYYSAQLGGGMTIPNLPPGVSLPGQEPDYLEAGDYTIDNGSGGSDVGAFRTTLRIPTPLNWTNQDAISSVNRAQGQTISWTGSDPNGMVTMTGVSFTSTVGAAFTCTERASAGSFTIPSYVLLNLPATGGGSSDVGSLMVSALNASRAATPPQGLDVLNVSSSSAFQKSVSYR